MLVALLLAQAIALPRDIFAPQVQKPLLVILVRLAATVRLLLAQSLPILIAQAYALWVTTAPWPPLTLYPAPPAAMAALTAFPPPFAVGSVNQASIAPPRHPHLLCTHALLT